MFEMIGNWSGMFTTNRTGENEELTPLLPEDLVETNGFFPIGKVQRFVIYPIDCGLGFKFKKAICTANGIQMIGVESKYLVEDRTLIVYNKSTMEALVDPEFTMTAKRDEILLYCLGELFKQQYEDLEVIHVNYLGTELPLRIFPSHSSFENEIQTKLFKSHKKDLLGLGYCTNKDRRALNEKHRFRPSQPNNLTDDEMKMAFLPNFSNYTLINTASYNEILNEAKCEKTLNFRNFRPQIIVNFERPFAEDNIEEIQIGPYIFNKVIPCVTEAINYNRKCSEKTFSRVYQHLQSDRTLFNIYPRFSKSRTPILPIFGMSMELQKDPKGTAPLNTVIEVGAIVSIKYYKSACLNSPTSSSVDFSNTASKPVTTRASIPDSNPVPITTVSTTTVSISAPPTTVVSAIVEDSPKASADDVTSPDSTYASTSADEVTSPHLAHVSTSTSTPTTDGPINAITDSESNSADASTAESAPDSAYASGSATDTSANPSATDTSANPSATDTSANASATDTSDNASAASSQSSADKETTSIDKK